MNNYYVVCRNCGARFLSLQTPRHCINRDCEAGWLDLPMFIDIADADRAAEAFAKERVIS